MTQPNPTIHAQGNEERVIKIAIRFCPLLIKITNALAFPAPTYRLVGEKSNTTAVFISDTNENLSSVYVGGQGSDLIVSCERAAELAVIDLMQKYKLIIHDITAARKGSVKSCAALRTLRRLETELDPKQMEKAWDTVSEAIHGTKLMNPITIDYIDTMYLILKRLKITVQPIESVQTGEGQFLAWLLLPNSDKIQQTEYIFGPASKSIQAAENRLARKVILFLIPIYNLQIVDANYDRSSVGSKDSLKETTDKLYLAAREAILPFNNDGEYAIVELQDDYSTPTDDAQQLCTATLKHPPPPKKRRCCSEADERQETAPTAPTKIFKVPDNLVTLFAQNTNQHNNTD